MAPDYDTPLPHVPVIPPEVLRKHHVHEPLDHRFRAAARLLQALWREDRELPIGSYRIDGKRRKLGSRITPAAGRDGGNFLSPAIAWLVRRELAYREPGALYDEHRLFTNLLSSMPLAFNLFGPLHIDLPLAGRVLAELFPELKGVEVKAVWFEHSPGRGDAALTGDWSAFDTFIAYQTPAGRKGFVAIEVKYSESCQEPVPAIRPRYDDLAEVSGLFIDPLKPALRTNPLQQLFREHLLAEAMLMRGDYDEGRFVVVAPRLNTLVTSATTAYQAELKPIDADHSSFAAITLEDVITAIAMAGEEQHAARLYRRYCDFWLVDGQLELSWFKEDKAHAVPSAAVITGTTSPLQLLPGGRA